jgi:hypothetical protein
MEIKDESYYSLSETSDLINIHPRTLQRRAKKMGAKMIDGRYLFTGHQIKELILHDTTTTRQKVGDRTIETTLVKDTNPLEDTNTITINIDVLNILKNRLNELEKENAELRDELTKEIPHQEKLRNAIQLITLEALEQNVQHKIFTDEEYQDIIGTMTEVDFQKEQVQYLRSRVEKQDEILNKLVNQVSERNFIEAKEKGLDKK